MLFWEKNIFKMFLYNAVIFYAKVDLAYKYSMCYVESVLWHF